MLIFACTCQVLSDETLLHSEKFHPVRISAKSHSKLSDNIKLFVYCHFNARVKKSKRILVKKVWRQQRCWILNDV